MAGPRANKVNTSTIVNRFLKFAQTSVYRIKVSPPLAVQNFINAQGRGFNYGNNGATSSSIRGVFCCGYVAPAPSATQNTIEHIMIATTGDSVDFGDAVTAERYRGSISNAHGGL